MCKSAAIAIAALAAATGGVLAQEPMIGSPAAGLRYAREVCAFCHYVEPDGPRIDELAPRAFTAIAADPKTTETGIRVLLQTTHIGMPDFILTEEQTDDIVAYLLSLKADTTGQ